VCAEAFVWVLGVIHAGRRQENGVSKRLSKDLTLLRLFRGAEVITAFEENWF